MTPVDNGHDSDETQVVRPPHDPPTDRAWGAVDDPLQDLSVPPVGPDEPEGPDEMVGPDEPVRPAEPVGTPLPADDDDAPSQMVVVPEPDDDAPVPAPGSADATAGNELPKPPEPALEANGLTLETKRGTLFHDVSLTVRPASLAAIVGPSGTGRSSLLLALTGRMGITAGMLAIAGRKLADSAAEIRALTAVARIGNTIGPEPALTVHESVDESCLLDNVNMAEGRLRFAEACTALDLTVEPSLLIADVGGERATLLAVALACVRISAVIVVDDIDRGVDIATQYRIVEALNRLTKMTKTGPAIIVSTADRGPVSGVPVIVELPPRVVESEVPNWPIPHRTQAPAIGGTPIAELPPGMSDANTTVIPVQSDPPTTGIPVVPEADDPDPDPARDPEADPHRNPDLEPNSEAPQPGGPFAPPAAGSDPYAPQPGGHDPDAPPSADPAAPEDAR
jgi:ABC-2 type transport system ATP-binding protein